MDKEEIKKTILRRFYEGVMKQGMYYQFWFDTFQQEIGIDVGLELRIYEELSAEGFFGNCFVNRVVCPSAKALLYCEQHQLVDPATVEKLEKIRKRILEACADLYEENLSINGEYHADICQRARINWPLFNINIGVLECRDLFEKDRPFFQRWQISKKGRELVKELRKRRSRLAEFEKLKALVGITRQDRGHRIEDLIGEAITDEGWKVSKRVRTEGTEQDLIINKERDYFLCSCKWEKRKIRWTVSSPLLVEVGDARCYAGIMVSMSGFTIECLRRAREHRTQKILFFGPGDVESLFSHAEEIFSEKQWFNDLLDEKIKKLIHKNIILVDGVGH